MIAILEKKEGRIVWVDWAKFLLVWLMVWGHAGLTNPGRQFVYAFHMPAFFILSGYLYNPHNWKKTVVSFGVPVIAFSLLNLAFVFMHMFLKGDYINGMKLLYQITPPMYRRNYGDNITLFTGLWFIEALFAMRILLGDIRVFSIIRRKYKIIMLSLIFYMSLEPLYISYIHPLDDFYIYKVFSCMPFMMLGIYIKECRIQLLHLKNWQLLLMFFIYVIMTLFNRDVDIFAEHFGQNYSYTFINAGIASVLFFNILSRFKTSKIVYVYSIGTLLILGVHAMIIKVCEMVTNHSVIPNFSLINSIIVMLVCYPLILFCSRYCPTLLGKSKR